MSLCTVLQCTAHVLFSLPPFIIYRRNTDSCTLSVFRDGGTWRSAGPVKNSVKLWKKNVNKEKFRVGNESLKTSKVRENTETYETIDLGFIPQAFHQNWQINHQVGCTTLISQKMDRVTTQRQRDLIIHKDDLRWTFYLFPQERPNFVPSFHSHSVQDSICLNHLVCQTNSRSDARPPNCDGKSYRYGLLHRFLFPL